MVKRPFTNHGYGIYLQGDNDMKITYGAIQPFRGVTIIAPK
jgi:hypothetical protein